MARLTGNQKGLSRGNAAVLDVVVQPGAARTEIVGVVSGALKVRVQAPPADGKANKALVALLAKRLGAPKTSIEIASGKSSRKKRILIQGLAIEDIFERLGLEQRGQGREEATPARPPRSRTV